MLYTLSREATGSYMPGAPRSLGRNRTMSGNRAMIAAGKEHHRNMEILNNLSGCGNALVENLLAKHVKECHKHNCDQADAGNVRNIFQNLYNHVVHLIVQSRALFGQLLFLFYKIPQYP